ncbi:MAG: DUF1002 domain-containing protein [Peptoniphilus sp.]|nr:DUF1002 domain-containing protein [Peptoniphilus sp.]
MNWKIKKIGAVVLAVLALAPSVALADIAVGDSIVSLGADLSIEEKQSILREFGAGEDTLTIEVTNDEEHKYLGGIVPEGKIGHKALSSSMITYTEKGKGIDVDISENINYITEETYRNALVTAGVTDAHVQISAPLSVTGTAALTGIMKAYETSTGEKISDEVKKIANEELVVTTGLERDLGKEKTNDLMNAVKVQFAKNMPKDAEEIRGLIQNISKEYDIDITDEQVEELTIFFNKLKSVDVDWDKIAHEAAKYSEIAKEYSQKVIDYLSSEEGQQTLEKSKGWFAKLIDWLKDFFANL